MHETVAGMKRKRNLALTLDWVLLHPHGPVAWIDRMRKPGMAFT